MPDEVRRRIGECRIAEHVIDVHVGVDDVTHRQRGVRGDRAAQCASDTHRAAGIDDRDAATSDDEPDVGDVVVTLRFERQRLAVVHEVPGCDLGDS